MNPSNLRSSQPPVALVTGASSGIGRSYARRLAAEGYALVVVARRKERLEALATELAEIHGTAVEILSVDLASPQGLERVSKRIDDDPPIDFLVHAAGFGTRGHLVDIDASVISSMLALHTLAAATLVRGVLPGMIDRNQGRVVFVSSLAAFFTTAEYTLYSATKAFLNTLTLGLADELAATAVRVQALCPGLVKTEFVDAPTLKGFRYEGVPDSYWATPEEVVETSIHRLEHRYRPIVVPTAGARIFMSILNTPLVGSTIRSGLSALARRRLKAGKPPLY